MADQPRTVAFYLPQFHPIPENDTWWGPGFTEWTNVKSAQPAFLGHDHPREPTVLGEYDLRDIRVMDSQVRLATENGIDAFCFYYYWFAGTRLLETPLNQYLHSDLELPFCISWANENWTRRWDGKDQEILISQDYGLSTPSEVFGDFVQYLQDPRYLRANGALVILVHRADHLPDPGEFARVWREEALKRSLGSLYLVATETRPNLDPRTIGFDAVAEFPPVGSNTLSSVQLMPPRNIVSGFRGRLMSYPRTAKKYMRRRDSVFRRHPGVMPSWDNTARRKSKATIYLNSSPSVYSEWLQNARLRESLHPGDGLVFVNAWNEWAEGAYLEPDTINGNDYLLATRGQIEEHSAASNQSFVGAPSVGWARSVLLATAATVLNGMRFLRDKLAKRG